MTDSLPQIQAAMDGAVADRVFPGGQLVLLEKGEVVMSCCAGMEVYDESPEVTPETCYDLASLTKPMSGVPLALYFETQGVLGLDTPIHTFLSDLKTVPLGGVTIAQLLSHTAGLPAWRSFYDILSPLPASEKVGALKRAIRECPLESKPGETRCYSDIGFLLLQEIIETVAGASVRELYNTLIRPRLPEGSPVYAEDLGGKARVAPTEACPWRRKVLCAEVHDDNTWSMGGEALHAGLFGTAKGVAAVVWEMHRASKGEGSLAAMGDYRRAIHSGVPLGVDRPSVEGSASGHLFSPGSWGHLGFTGTSFWVDPLREAVVVLLTNRVHPTRENWAIRGFRPKIHNLLMSSRYVIAPEKS